MSAIGAEIRESEPGSEPPENAERGAFDADGYRAISLRRLAELVKLRTEVSQEQGPEAALHRWLVDRALYTVYCECREAGAEREARHVLAPSGPSA